MVVNCNKKGEFAVMLDKINHWVPNLAVYATVASKTF